jgi:transcriptional regulator with PAS, ATPase and Fis domain
LSLALTADNTCPLDATDEQPLNSVACDPFAHIIGECDHMRKVFQLVERVADTDSTILLNGETGTGKGLVAKAIHQSSYRRNKPFVQINCGAIPENLLESELFGHVRGAFTGATAPKKGKFEQADGGTIFLDEIGDMSPDLQVKVLRALEEREFEPVGGCKTIKVDVRVIAATHRDLKQQVKDGSFREDLYYRLYVIPIQIAPLRARKADIPLLADYFMSKFNLDKHMAVEGIATQALSMMIEYEWPGNVRELRNVMERLVVIKGEGEISAADLPEEIRTVENILDLPAIEFSDEGICLNTAVNEFEKNLIYKSLEKSQWVKKKAAKLLHLKRTTLVEKIKRHELEQPCNLPAQWQVG